jgi:hypothetical protein
MEISSSIVTARAWTMKHQKIKKAGKALKPVNILKLFA